MEVMDLPLNALQLSQLRPPRTASVALVEAIKQNGIVEPIIVRPSENGYEVVEGLRRFDAAKKLGLASIPALIKDLSDQEVASLFLIGNMTNNTISPSELAKESSSGRYFSDNTLEAANTIASIMRTGEPPSLARIIIRNLDIFINRKLTEDITCRSGEIRTRLKDPSKAFKFYNAQWSVQVDGQVLNNQGTSNMIQA
jgi:ParB/RepB/Spo0J family partition protein